MNKKYCDIMCSGESKPLKKLIKSKLLINLGQLLLSLAQFSPSLLFQFVRPFCDLFLLQIVSFFLAYSFAGIALNYSLILFIILKIRKIMNLWTCYKLVMLSKLQ